MASLKLRHVAVLAIVLVAGVFMFLRLDDGSRYGDFVTAENAGLFVAAAVLMAIAVVGVALAWCKVLTSLDANVRTSRALRVFLYSWPARYIPGTLPYHAVRVMAADVLGTTKGVVLASIAYESVLVLCCSGFVGAVGLTIGVGVHHSSLGAYAIAGFLVAALPLALHPRILVPVANSLLRLARRSQLDAASVLSAKQTLLVFCAFASAYCINGAGFWLVLRVVAPDAHVNPALAIGAYSIAGLIGVLALFAPSGLGVREAVLVALLGSVISPEMALLAAGLARVLNVIADLGPPALLAGYDATKRLRANRRSVNSGAAPVLQQR